MSEQTPSNYKPYEWGEESFTVQRSLRRPSQESEEIQKAQYKARVGHPNVVNKMQSVEGHVRIDDQSPQSRNDIRESDDNGWPNALTPREIHEINSELRRDEEERNLTAHALGELAVVLDQKEANPPRFRGKAEHERSVRFMQGDQSYLRERLDRLSRDGGAWDHESEPITALSEQNTAWNNTTERFTQARSTTGERAIDVLHQQALDEAKTSESFREEA